MLPRLVVLLGPQAGDHPDDVRGLLPRSSSLARPNGKRSAAFMEAVPSGFTNPLDPKFMHLSSSALHLGVANLACAVAESS
jgi:hypothetical protein